jgi:hypothetical protein
MISRWHYLYRRYLGWLPVQFCMICERAYWAGFPDCWNWQTWRFDWMPWMQDYCCKKCADEDCGLLFGMIRRYDERLKIDQLDYQPDEADYMVYVEGCCPFCGVKLRSREISPGCDESEIYCPECSYTEGIQ